MQLAARHSCSRASLRLGVSLCRTLKSSTTALCWPEPPRQHSGPRAIEPHTLFSSLLLSEATMLCLKAAQRAEAVLTMLLLLPRASVGAEKLKMLSGGSRNDCQGRQALP